MKPVVSSLVALAIAIAPMTVLAKPAHTKNAKVVKKAEKAEKAENTNSEKEKSEKTPIVHVKATKKDGAHAKSLVHHAHNVDLAGPGHKEPKVDHNGAIVQASMKTSSSHGKQAKVSPKASEMPRLPNPNAGKPSKGGAEKGARKATEKKQDASDSNDGEPTRDEEFAELVARIRGRHAASGADVQDAPAVEKDSKDGVDTRDLLKNVPSKGQGEKAAKNASHTTKSPPCAKDPVEIIRGPEVDRFELTKCDGTVAPLAVEHLSILVRPGAAARPIAPVAELAKKPGQEISRGIRRVDPRLVERLQSVVDHFGKSGAPAKLFVISGYRPTSVGSTHSTGRAIDFRVDGVKNEDVVSFCKTLVDTGCGYYPNSSFVHLDVREPGAGHVSWIDASGPGETPRYVMMWPPPPIAARHIEKVSASSQSNLAGEGEILLRARRPVDRESAPDAVDEHPADVAQ